MAYTSAQLQATYSKIHQGLTPSPSAIVLLDGLAVQNAAGGKTDAQTYQAVLDTADADAAVAITAYQYFTGKTPTQAGLAYLVNSTTNPTDLNDAYYAQFDQTNRYINFAQNLGLVGEAAAFFQAAYTGFTFAQVVTAAYEIIIGSDKATAAGINATAAIADIVSRQSYFATVAAERFQGMNQDLAIKAAVIGYIMSEAVKANIGNYSNATSAMLTAIDAGTATYNTILTQAYPTSPTGGGSSDPGVSNGGFPTVAPVSASTTSVDLSTSSQSYNGQAANPGFVVTASNPANTMTVSLLDASGSSDQVGLTLATSSAASGGVLAGLNVGKLTLGGVETLNVTSAGSLTGGGAVNSLTLDATTAAYKTIAIFGSAPLSLNIGVYPTSLYVNGGGAKGELTLDFTTVTAATVGVTVAGGLANDTIKPVALAGASNVTQTVYGGGGGDSIVLGASHTEQDVMLYRVAADSLYDVTGIVGASGTSTPNSGKMDVITNFVNGRDKIDITAFGLSSAQGQVVSRTAASTAALETLAATSNFYQDGVGSTRAVVAASVGADIFLFVDANKNGVYDSGSDLVVKLAGLAAFGGSDLLR